MIAKKCVCGKTAYASEQKAKNEARWIERHGKVLRPYYSNECHCWHLTSEVKFKGKKAKRFK